MSEVATAAPEPPKRFRYKATCGGCGRQYTRQTTRGNTWRCPNPDCGRVNPGPALIAEMVQPPAPGARRRQARRERAAERREEVAAAAAPAAAPVRRVKVGGRQAEPRESSPGPAAKPRESSTGPAAKPAASPPSPPAPRRGLLDRIFYGEDE